MQEYGETPISLDKHYCTEGGMEVRLHTLTGTGYPAYKTVRGEIRGHMYPGKHSGNIAVDWRPWAWDEFGLERGGTPSFYDLIEID